MTKDINYKTIKKAALTLGKLSEEARNQFIQYLAEIVAEKADKIIEANKEDLTAAEKSGLPKAFIERLVLDKKGVETIVLSLKDILKLKSGLGEIIEKRTIQQGIIIQKVAVPLGVIAIIYEARPEVTIDVAALCIKSGNVAILKGGSEAMHTNVALYQCVQEALAKAHLSKDMVYFISSSDRAVTDSLLKQHEYIDLLIARGGYGLVKHVFANSTIPVLAHAAGGARMYIDKSADTSIIEHIIINAKTTKPAACNSLDSIVIHKDIADKILPSLKKSLQKNNVEIVEDNWDEEFLDLKVNIKIVKDIDEAIEFINTHTKRHSEGIIAQDKEAIEKFTSSIDAAALFINTSTRLHDGFIFGLGSEMGISTGKLHARGPVGLKELTTYKWEVYGNGQIRN